MALHPLVVSGRLAKLGIPGRIGRNTALMENAALLPAAVLSDLLGLSVSGMLLYLARHQDWVCSGECPEQLPGDITLEGSHDLLGCAAFGSSTFDIGASLGINPHPHDG
ncbi:hypothetical protein BDB13_5647 [Rhodococcus sp. OK302]|nr:hypothetical protein BDB13_5647 [Rhodococcus sp. OK302]